jgi:hypothetical protein
MTFKDQIKKDVKISSILSHYGFKAPSNGDGNWECIHHNSKSKTSLSVDDNLGLCSCVSDSCNFKGDIYNVVALCEKWDIKKDFVMIVEKVCKISGIPNKMDNIDLKELEKNRNKEDLYKKILKKFYNLTKEHFKDIKDYVKEKRKYTDEDLKNIELGYLPNKEEFTNIKNKIIKEIPESKDIHYEEDGKKHYFLDSLYIFVDRIIHPTEYEGEIIYLTGEHTPKTDRGYVKLKAIFSPSGIAEPYLPDSFNVENKDMLLFAEGYQDALALKLLGFPVVCFGTCKISKMFIDKWKHKFKPFKKVIVCFDNDENESGIKGAKAFCNELIKDKFTNLYISQLNKDDDKSKLDIEEFLHQFNTIEEKQSAIKQNIINVSKDYIDFLMEELSDAETKHGAEYAGELAKEIVLIVENYPIIKRMKVEGFVSKILNFTKGHFKDFVKECRQEAKTERENNNILNEINSGSSSTYNVNTATTEYYLAKKPQGYYFYKIIQMKNETGGFYSTLIEIASFSNIKSFKLIQHSFKNENIVENKLYEFNVVDDEKYAMTPTQIRSCLLDGARVKSKLRMDDETQFCKILEQMPVQEIKTVDYFHIKNNKYYDSINYKLAPIITHNNIEDFKFTEDVPSEIKDFLKIKPDITKVKRCLELINQKIARTKEEEIAYKISIAFSIASILKFELKRIGISLHPIMIVSGRPKTGKSMKVHLLCIKMFNSGKREQAEMFKQSNVRLTNEDYSTFVCLVDELEEFYGKENFLNDHTTQGYSTPKKGKKEGGFRRILIADNFIITNNHFDVKNTALSTRIINQIVNEDSPYKLSSKEFLELTEIIPHLGKYIYDKLTNYNIQKIYDDVCEQNKGMDSRDLDKYAYVKIGEHILNDIGLLKDTPINVNHVLNADTTFSMNVRDVILNEIKNIVLNITHRGQKVVDIKENKYGEEYETKEDVVENAQSILIEKDISDNAKKVFAQKGIYFDNDWQHILINTNILPHLNERLARQKMMTYKQSSKLFDDLEQTGITFSKVPIPVYNTSVRGLKIVKHLLIADSDGNDENEGDSE